MSRGTHRERGKELKNRMFSLWFLLTDVVVVVWYDDPPFCLSLLVVNNPPPLALPPKFSLCCWFIVDNIFQLAVDLSLCLFLAEYHLLETKLWKW